MKPPDYETGIIGGKPYSYIYKSFTYIPIAYHEFYRWHDYKNHKSKECYPTDRECIRDWEKRNPYYKAFGWSLILFPFAVGAFVLCVRERAKKGFR